MMMVERQRILYFAFMFLLMFGFTFEQSQPLSSVTERAALLQLRSSLGLRAEDWPRKADPCKAWNGVECSGGRVVGINISGLKRTRIGSNMNPRFAIGGALVNLNLNLTLLASFNASNFALPGQIPNWPSSLRVLDLSRNSLSGSIPSSLARLTLLDISSNFLSGSVPDALWSMPGLTRLDISKNYFQGNVPVFAPSNTSLGRNCLQGATDQRTSAECASFYSQRGLIFDNFGITDSERSKRKRNILVGVFILFVLIFTATFFLIPLLFCIRKRKAKRQLGTFGSSLGVGDVFTYQQLVQATGGFSDTNLIKRGRSGDLFRGVLENGALVAIKRIENKNEANPSSELDFFNNVSVSQSRRFVPLLGHCMEIENVKFLVYKYMPNGDLAGSLFRKARLEDERLQSLDWITRLKIAVGAAEGLCYLHECVPPLVHRDVQASSILLDDKFEVRLGSLSEVCTEERDCRQNMIARLLQSSEQGASGSRTATCVYDVHCFGKVLLELVTGKLGLSATSDAQTKEWLEQTLPFITTHDKEMVTKVVDPSLIIDGDDLLEEVWAVAVLAKSCLDHDPARRPLMRYIVKALENPSRVVREESSSSGRLGGSRSRRRHFNEICPEPVVDEVAEISGNKHDGR